MKATKKNEDNIETFSEWQDRMYKVMADFNSKTDPNLIKLREEHEEYKAQQMADIKENRRLANWRILHFFVMLLLIPVLISLWNMHPVLGILGIIGYIWLIRNKINTGFYFG